MVEKRKFANVIVVNDSDVPVKIVPMGDDCEVYVGKVCESVQERGPVEVEKADDNVKRIFTQAEKIARFDKIHALCLEIYEDVLKGNLSDDVIKVSIFEEALQQSLAIDVTDNASMQPFWMHWNKVSPV